MSEFRKGEHVRATIEGPVTQDALGSIYVDVGDVGAVEIPKVAPRVTIERVAPADWPPRPGDLWRDRDGEIWFVVTHMDHSGPHLRASDDSIAPADYIARHFGPLTLVHREDEQDGGGSDG